MWVEIAQYDIAIDSSSYFCIAREKGISVENCKNAESLSMDLREK